jgi:hypothetical protein
VPKVLLKRRVILSLDKGGGLVLALFMDLKNRGENIGGHRCQNKRFSRRSRTLVTRSPSVVADDHTFWRTSLQDGVYRLGINLLVSGQANSGRYIGNQPSAGVYWNAGRHLSVSAAYAHFFSAHFWLRHPARPRRGLRRGMARSQKA